MSTRDIELEHLAGADTGPRRAESLLGVLAAGVVLGLIILAVRADTLNWAVVAQYIFHPIILNGVYITVVLTLSVVVAGLVAGIALCAMLLSRHWFLARYARVYIWLFRSLPPLILMIFWYNIALFVAPFTFAIPGASLEATFAPGGYLTPFTAAALGLIMHEAAFMAEIVRSGYLSIGAGVHAAGLSLGMRRRTLLTKVVSPLLMRISIPTLINQAIYVLKMTSVAFAVSLTDILASAQSIYARNSQVIPLLIVACFWYLVLVSALMILQRFVERRLNRGA